MAAKAPLSLYADDDEGRQRVQEYKDSQDELRRALDSRQNQLFDPTLLAISQALLSPTKTGSFGEVIGNVAGAAGTAQQAEEKRAREIAGMRMELAQQGLQSYQSTATDKSFNELMNRARPGSPAPSSGAPAATAAPTAGGASTPTPEPQGRSITSEDIALLASRPGGTEKAKILGDMIARDRDRYSISMNGIVFDKDTRQYLNLEIPGQKQEDFATKAGTYRMTPYEYSQYKQADAAGQGQQFMDAFRGMAPAAPAPAGAPAPASPNAAPPGRMSVPDAAAQAKANETKAVKTAEAEVGRTQEQINAGQDATGRMASYSALRGIAARPDAKEIFGIFNRPDFGSALLNLVQEGVQSPGTTTIRAGALEDTLRNLGLPQEQIDRYRFGLSIMANIQLQQAKLAAGQGAISNFERDLFASATLSPKDNPATILGKLSMMEARTQFERERAAALRRSKMDADDFAFTPEGQRLAENYLRKVSGIATNFGVQPQARPAQRPASGGSGGAGPALRKELGLEPLNG